MTQCRQYFSSIIYDTFKQTIKYNFMHNIVINIRLIANLLMTNVIYIKKDLKKINMEPEPDVFET